MMKSRLFILFLFTALSISAQNAGSFKFDDSSVTFPDGTSQNTAAGNGMMEMQPPENMVRYIRAIFAGIEGSAPESNFIDHMIITEMQLGMLNASNSIQYRVFKFKKPNDEASVDLLNRFANNATIPTAEFKVVVLDQTGMPRVKHQITIADAKIVDVKNLIDFDENNGYVFEEEYALEFSQMTITNSINGQETVLILGNF